MTNNTINSIKRGEIYMAQLVPTSGSEQEGKRPVLVIQNDTGNAHSATVIVAAVSSKVQRKGNMPVHVKLDKTYGLGKESVVKLEQLRTLDKNALGSFVGTLDGEAMSRVNKALGISVGLQKNKPDWSKALELCLCSQCAGQFYNSPDHRIKRSDMNQQFTDSCDFCNVRRGFDFLVLNKNDQQ